jgi:ankyrin repeat protein
MKSNVISVRFLLARGANPNVVDKCGHTPLHVAVVLAKNMDIVKLLLNQNDANVNYLDNNGFDALRFTKYNKYGLTEIREIGDFDINCREENGRTPLHFAMIPINVETARYLLEKGADPTIGDNEGTTPFHLAAALSRETDILGLFLANNKQFDIDHRDKFETTALHMAVKQSNTASAEYLLSKGANPNAAVQHGYTTLHIAAKYAKDMDMVKLLLNHKGTNVNYLDNKGRNALHYAMDNMHGHGKVIANLLREKMATTSEGDNYEPKNIAALVPSLTEEDSDIETIRLLIEDGQDVSAMTWGENGANALHLAAANEETTDLIDAFLETGKFDIDGVDNNGRTPLHYAIKRPNPVTINARRLIKMGAEPSIADKNGVTPLHMAAKNENAESMDLIEILLNTEAVDVNCVDKQGRTPLACARDNKHGLSERIANRLKENGAVRVEEEICQDNLLDECTSGGEATGNSLVNDEDENESETENPKKAPTFKIVVDSSGEKIRIQIKEGTKLGKGNWGEHVMNALRSALRKAKATEIIDISLDTESRDPHVTTPPECTSDDDNENMVKKVLTEAIAHSDAEKVRNLIEMGADISKVTWRGLNALHAASVCAKTTEILDVILASGEIDINGRNEDGETALHFALRANKMTTARYLLEKGADTTKRNNAGNTPFHVAAAFSRETDILDFIMANNKKFDIDHRNQSGLTALHMAIKVSNTATAEYLLSKGANPNAADRNGRTPLHVAAYYAKDMEIVKLLLNRKNVNVNYLDNSGHSALFYTMSNEHGLGEAIAKLLRGKMAAKTKGINHEPENMAAPVPTGRIKQDSDMETIRFLIENGQDISAKTWGENGAKALHVAAANEETTELIDIILETGQCNINGVDSDRRTPLHYAIKRPDPVTINARRLIKMGADPNSADKNGVTPLHMAARNAESMDLIELLLNSEALDVNCVDKQGLTPLAYARGNKHGLGERIIARLRESGANEG